MKNTNFSLDGLPGIDELDNLLQKLIESGGNFVNYMMKILDDKKLLPDFNGMTPNTYGDVEIPRKCISMAGVQSGICRFV